MKNGEVAILFVHLVCFLVIILLVIMAALWNRAGHYIFVFWFLLLSIFYLFSSPNLSRCRLDVYHVYHTSTYGVAVVRI